MSAAEDHLELPTGAAVHLARHRQVVLERAQVVCDSDILTGTVRVQNIAYEKLVVVRYTLDDWETFSDLAADWEESVWEEGRREWDKFSFAIPLPAGSWSLRVQLAISYDVAGLNFWDNNGARNYELTAEKSWRQCAWSAVRLVQSHVTYESLLNLKQLLKGSYS